MKIHREGYNLLAVSASILILLQLVVQHLVPAALPVSLVIGAGLLGFMLWFFRHPRRPIDRFDDQLVYAPADGKVVVIEEVEEKEYFHDRRLQVSIFMSPLNVHLNRVPIGGKVRYYRYHPGRYLVAWHPKSSSENERSTIVIDNGSAQILLRQIAGAMARRIRTYVEAGGKVQQGAELGFIKFGSRVDVLLPLDARIKVEIGQQVYGNRSLIAQLEK